MPRLEAIEAIGNRHAQLLREKAGITSVAGLLKAGAKREGRLKIAQVTGLDPNLITHWVNLADLLRVKGIGEEYLRLLHLVGIDTVAKLQNESPENLLENIQMVNKARQFVRRLPTLEMVTDWIEQARELSPAVEP